MTPQSHHLLPSEKCGLGCPVLDACLGGGIPCNSITEIVAESGSGKTQLCLQLSLSAQLPFALGGLSASSLYLHTEFPFPSRRLYQLSLAFRSLHPQIVNDPCDNIFVHSVHSADQLFDLMPKIESFIANATTQLPVRLIVVDSVAALFRSEFGNTSSALKKRSSLFFKIAGKLKALASRFNLAVVVTNQVVDFVGSGDGVNSVRIGNLAGLYSSGRRVCPALGLAWANCVNVRLFVSMDEDGFAGGDDGGGGGGNGSFCGQKRRRLHVVFAPHLPYLWSEFVIRKEGVSGVAR